MWNQQHTKIWCNTFHSFYESIFFYKLSLWSKFIFSSAINAVFHPEMHLSYMHVNIHFFLSHCLFFLHEHEHHEFDDLKCWCKNSSPSFLVIHVWWLYPSLWKYKNIMKVRNIYSLPFTEASTLWGNHVRNALNILVIYH